MSWWPLVACCLGTFLLLVYTSIVTVALPSIAADLGAGHSAQQWVVNVYTVALAGFLLGAGSIGDTLGIARVYLVGVAAFTVATALAGFAPSVGWLIAGRAVQGVAGAVMFACIPALIGRAYAEPRTRAVAFAVWGAVAGAASAIGTIAGGVLAEFVGWRWLFFAALPFCLIALAAALRLRALPGRPPASGVRPPVDWAGLGCATLGITALAYAITETGSPSGPGLGVLAAALVAGCSAVGFVWAERRAVAPVLPLSLLRTPAYLAALLAAFGYYFAAFGQLPAISNWLQLGEGLGSAATATILLAQLIAFVLASALLSARLRGAGVRGALGWPMLAIAFAAATGLLLLTGVGWITLVPFLVLSGAAAGVISPALPALALAAAPAEVSAAATSGANAARQLGLALGVAVCGSVAAVPESGPLAGAFLVCAVLALSIGILVLRLGAAPETKPQCRAKPG
ncbi:MFS transporter [Leucobacter chromiireducens]|uniref:MFS transporter n=1 Tax=Leucobacter chromiireducens TaxID=283877 RepID=UPI00192560AF